VIVYWARRHAALILATAAVVSVAALTGCGAAARTDRDGVARVPATVRGWGTALAVPGTVALNKGANARINSVSCASAGNCSAGGAYTDRSHHLQAFVVSEVNGVWRRAEEVPGTGALNPGGYAAIASVSCGSAGNCSAGGLYADRSRHNQAFVVSEVNGAWRQATEVPGIADLNTGGSATTYTVSCASAGNCSAGGLYAGRSGHLEAFVVSEVGGAWKTAEEVPGTATLNVGGRAAINSVSCASAGNCSAGGAYTDRSDHPQAFVVSEVGGAWQTAEEMPGIAALNAGGYAAMASISCASAGNCSAGGQYKDRARRVRGFVVGEVNGVWRRAEEVPGTAALNRDDGWINSVSCASPGNCSAAGPYTDRSGHLQTFVVSEVGGAWKTAEEVPGIAALNRGGHAGINSVSCASAGNCSAGGQYTGRSRHPQAFVVSEVSGVWRRAELVPGTAALNTGGSATIYSVSCASKDACSAGGQYTDASGHQQAFVVGRP